MKRKIIAMTLCVVMLLSFMSIGGSALSGEAEYSPVESNISLKSWVSAEASSNEESAGCTA